MRAEASERRAGTAARVLFILILALALFLRVYRLEGQSFWADEGNSVALAGRPFAVIARDAALDIHPPLYYFLLKIWASLFGTGMAAVRGLSVLFGAGVVALTGALGARAFGRRAGLAAAFLSAISPMQVYYSQEARMYIPMAFWAVLMAWAGWRWMESTLFSPGGGRRAWPAAVGYILAGAAGMYTHYFFPVVLLTLNLVFLIAWVGARRWGALWRWAGMQAAVLLLYAPWLPTGMTRLFAWPKGGGALSAGAWSAMAWRTLCLGPAGWDRPFWYTLPFLLALILGMWPRRSALSGAPARAGWTLSLLGWLLPPAVLLLGGVFQPSRLKFLIAASPFLALTMGQGLARMWEAFSAGETRRRAARAGAIVLFAGLVLASAVALQRYYFDPSAVRDDYRGMVAFLRATAGPEDGVILNAPGQWDVFSYYYGDAPWPVYRLPAERPPVKESLENALADIVTRHRRLYVLYWALDESDPERIMENWLDAHAFKGIESWYGNVRFVVYTTARGWGESLETKRLGISFEDGIGLESVARPADPVAAGDILPLSFTWRAEQKPARRWKVFVQVLDGANHLVGQRDAEPGGGDALTTLWEAGEVVVDNHGVFIEPGTPPGSYRLIAGLYDVETGQRARVDGGPAAFVELGEVEVMLPEMPLPPNAVRPMFAVEADAGPLRLLGYDLHGLGKARQEGTLSAAEPAHLALYWHARQRPAALWRFQLWIDDTLWVNWTALGGEFTAEQWRAGELVRDQVDAFLPAGISPGWHRLRLLLLSGAEVVEIDLGRFQVR